MLSYGEHVVESVLHNLYYVRDRMKRFPQLLFQDDLSIATCSMITRMGALIQ